VSLADETPADAMAVAAAERRLIGQRSREGIQRAREEGVRIGRPPKPTLAGRLAPRLAHAAAGMRQLQGNRSVSDRE
jgi:DNA invertase Pin-like site-specific DNA recombinase